jgi:hypothetical protein
MPKVLRRNLPPALYQHLLDRVQERGITAKDLILFVNWLDTQPDVPEGEWFKRFPGMTVCGEGALVKSLLTPNQTPPETSFKELELSASCVDSELIPTFQKWISAAKF